MNSWIERLSIPPQGRRSCAVEEKRTLQVGTLFNVLTVRVFFLVEEEERLFRHFCSECYLPSVQKK